MKLSRYPVTIGTLLGSVAIVILVVVGACAPKVSAAPPPLAPSMAPAPSRVAIDASTPTSIVMAHPPSIQLRNRGVNLSGGEFGSNVPGTIGRDYAYPTNADVDYFMARGVNHFRVPFRHERLQPTLKGPINEVEWAKFVAPIDYATGKGADVAIEPHNSFRHGKDCKVSAPQDKACTILSETDVGDFWGRIAQRFKANPHVQLNVTNEPHHMTTETVVALDNAALREIRRVGFAGLVLVPGNAWTGAGHWTEKFDGNTPNSVAMLKINDPSNHFAFEVHQYLDKDASGSGDDCVSETIGVERLAPFVAWLRTNGKSGFLGEIAAPNTPTCAKAIARSLEVVEADYDVWLGWDWWGAGSRWSKDYKLSVQPLDGVDRPQLAWLLPFMACKR